MADEQINKLATLLPNYSNKQEYSVNAADWLGQFTQSTVSGMGELVGITPGTDTLDWRAKHPVGNLMSSVAGTLIPYTGWFKATKAIKSFDKAIDTIGDLEKAPFLTGAAREAARFAPFEAGRVAASQVVGDQSLGDMTFDAGLNLALGAGIGGVLHGIAAAGVRDAPLARLAPGIDVAAPRQLQARYIQDLIDSGQIAGPQAEALAYRLNRLRQDARTEEIRTGARYVNELEGGKNADQLNRLFNTGDGQLGVLRRMRLAATGRDFASEQAWKEVAKGAGLGERFEDFAQYPRVVEFRTKLSAEEMAQRLQTLAFDLSQGKISQSKLEQQTKALGRFPAAAKGQATNVERLITENLQHIGLDWYMAKEANDGLFVMARKIRGKPGVPTELDRWLLFKTDSPGRFNPAAQKWANTMIAKNAWTRGFKLADDGGDVYNSTVRLMNEVPFNSYETIAKEGTFKRALDKLLPQGTVGKSNELVSRVRDQMREYLAPARVQFAKSPRANWVFNLARASYDQAQLLAQKLMYGEFKVDQTKNLFWNALNGIDGSHSSGAIKPIIDELNDEEIKQLWSVWRKGGTVAAGEVSPKVTAAAARLKAIDSDLWASVNKTQAATGNQLTRARQNYYLLGRKWEGDTRIALRGDGGEVLGVAAGGNRRAAQANARRLQEKLREEGLAARIAEEFDLTAQESIPADLRPILRTPGFVLERQGVRGFQWDMEPWTRDELLHALGGAVEARTRYMANMTVNDLMTRELDKIATEDPAIYRQVKQRLDDLAGVQSEFSQWQNKLTDRLLAPVLGNQSATKIARAANTAMFHLQLGAMKLSFPIVNALTFLQTVLPESVYITTAAPEALAGRYTYFASGGTRGPVGAFGVMNPLRLMSQSLKEMRRPGSELVASFERATNERVIDPRLVEEYVGESAVKVHDLKGAISGPGGFAQWLLAVSEYLPANSERMARSHAFTVGHIVGRDSLRLEGDALYRFAKQFTENTMFLYSTADRPRLFTTPIGSMFGLFKNWMFNYTSMMLDYSAEAARGNWAPLAWQTAGTVGVGGLAATPLYVVADAFAEAFTDKTLLELTYDEMETDSGDALLFGLPAALSGISLSSQTSSPLSNPVRDASQLFGVVHLDRLAYLSKGMGAGWDHWEATGESPARSSVFRDSMVQAFAPTTLYRIMGAAQEEQLRSLSTGYPIINGMSGMDRVLYAAGFNPTELDKAHSVAAQLYKERDSRKAAVTALGRAYADAMDERDSEAMRRLLRQAVAIGVDPSSVLRSAMAVSKKAQTPMLERTFKPADLMRFQQVLGGQ